MVSIEVLSLALRSLAAPGMTPKALRAALRDRHPEASKKAIVRAAFLALIEAQTQDDRSGCSVETLHSFALAERASSDDGPVLLSPRRRRRQRRAATAAGAEMEASVAA